MQAHLFDSCITRPRAISHNQWKGMFNSICPTRGSYWTMCIHMTPCADSHASRVSSSLGVIDGHMAYDNLEKEIRFYRLTSMNTHVLARGSYFHSLSEGWYKFNSPLSRRLALLPFETQQHDWSIRHLLPTSSTTAYANLIGCHALQSPRPSYRPSSSSTTASKLLDYHIISLLSYNIIHSPAEFQDGTAER